MKKSTASWVPAVPPPPVAGAAVTGLAVGFDVAGVVGFAVTVSVVTPGFGEVASENVVVDAASGVVAEGPEQADTAAETKMVMAPQPTTLNIALSPAPAMVARTFIEPPHAAGRRRPTSPAPAPETGTGRKYAWRSGRGPCRPKADPRKRRWP